MADGNFQIVFLGFTKRVRVLGEGGGFALGVHT